MIYCKTKVNIDRISLPCMYAIRDIDNAHQLYFILMKFHLFASVVMYCAYYFTKGPNISSKMGRIKLEKKMFQYLNNYDELKLTQCNTWNLWFYFTMLDRLATHVILKTYKCRCVFKLFQNKLWWIVIVWFSTFILNMDLIVWNNIYISLHPSWENIVTNYFLLKV
jgi:hypothetical protein